ncbi:hypothetical protein SAMN02745866_00428 [Alteromonadaceae bacterium Bs31]|nr:hypothetical protein SAMN02745866_00428 [Alteromonadaceae bacterium Bs31]
MKTQKFRGPWLPVIQALLVTVCSDCCHSEEPPPELLPSEELLQFLSEFDDVDDETFALLLERGKRDVAEEQRDNSASKEARDTDERGSSHE